MNWKLTTSNKPQTSSKFIRISTYIKLMARLLPSLKAAFSACSIHWNVFIADASAVLGWNSRRPTNRYSEALFHPKQRVSKKTSLLKNKTPITIASENTLWLFFLQSWQLQRPQGSLTYNTHRDFRIMFMANNAGSPFNSLISSRRYFARWVDAYNFIFNLMYADAQVQVLSNKLFLEESLVFNWNYSLYDYKLFRYIQPFFIFKDLPHGAYIHSAIDTILLDKVDTTLVVDINNHKKLLTYFRRYSVCTVGLVPANQSPWKLSYPIPAFSDSSTAQYYFLRWLFFIKGKAQATKYSNLKKLWTIQ